MKQSDLISGYIKIPNSFLVPLSDIEKRLLAKELDLFIKKEDKRFIREINSQTDKSD